MGRNDAFHTAFQVVFTTGGKRSPPVDKPTSFEQHQTSSLLSMQGRPTLTYMAALLGGSGRVPLASGSDAVTALVVKVTISH
eukprot:scaffold141009_cov18-Prasinocladus_malaysianus.AAC.1